MSGIINATNLEVANIKDSTGTNTAMTVDSSGRILTPSRPLFYSRGYASTIASATAINGVTPSGTIRIMLFDEVAINIGSHFSNTTGKFTVPIAGIYQVNWNIGYKASNSYSKVALFLTSSDEPGYGYSLVWSSNNHSYNSSAATVYVNASVGQEFAMCLDTQYTTPNTHIAYSSFGAMLVG
jgi:hypothetical protein